ncbi:MAG: NAD(P)H-dependent glycerol-3-phosphate dehydrogenase [Saprospiraceae bacterium]|nr:NAD(P)-dependent glycerol-3-phosphate dehydrogenase [Saprospiraceae bacterium]
MEKKIGVIGSGSFGLTVAQLLAVNGEVILFTRREEVETAINQNHFLSNIKLSPRIVATRDIERVCNECNIIFPALPSSAFRKTMQSMSMFLHPYHMLIHATKGLDTSHISPKDFENADFDRRDVNTMSEVILQETNVIRVGCMSGPNLAKELQQGLPAATVIASEFDEVIKKGQTVLMSKNFTVFGSHDLKGVEIAGAFKNIIAIASGMSEGMGLGKNMQALLITRGLGELIDFGIALGVTGEAFLGTAGIGDMVATAFSPNSRNFTFGYRFAKGETLEQILSTTDEVVEGVNTLKIIHQLAKNSKITLPITFSLYKVVFEGMDKMLALHHLMGYAYGKDVIYSIHRSMLKDAE